MTQKSFRRELAPARTFGFLRDVEQLKAAGLARGGSLENAIVVDDERILNPKGRFDFPDEFVRHKILDAVGDLSLLGYPILGHVRAHKAGHDINHRLVEKILANPTAGNYRICPARTCSKTLQSATSSFSPELALSGA